ncbi:MAG: hypothetical protein GY750_04340 [Lentisphaerae bacterium]|nr:hypothetical protein [Lentisphaerota bacterium]MCP4100640.1 hypothetical protein [Lentisphaerota bacterium]
MVIFIDSDWRTQLKTRITRDIHDRKYTEEKAIATFLQSNLREFRQFGAESKKWSDVHIFCRSDYYLELESIEEGLFQRHNNIFSDDFVAVSGSSEMAPVATPLDANGNLIAEYFIYRLEEISSHDIHKILIGNSKEGRREELSIEDRQQLLLMARRYFPGAVVFDASSSSVKITRQLLTFAAECGADAAVIDTSLLQEISSFDFIKSATRGIELTIL